MSGDDELAKARAALGVDDWKPSLGLSGEDAKMAEAWIGAANVRHLSSGRRDRPKRIEKVRTAYEYYRTPEDRFTLSLWRLNRVVNGRPQYHGEYRSEQELAAEIKRLRLKGNTVNAWSNDTKHSERRTGPKSFKDRYKGFGI